MLQPRHTCPTPQPRPPDCPPLRPLQAAEYWQLSFVSLLSLVQAMVVWLGLASGMCVCVNAVAQVRPGLITVSAPT